MINKIAVSKSYREINVYLMGEGEKIINNFKRIEIKITISMNLQE